MSRKRQESDAQAMERIRQRRRGRMVRRIALAAVALALALVYFTGVFGTSIALVSDWFDTASLAVYRGDGYPVSVPLQSYVSSRGMTGGAAVLTGEDFYVFSSSGRTALHFQHKYTNPAMAASSNRACVYSRFGYNLTVTSRTRQLYTQKFDSPILTAAMGGDALAVATKESQTYTAAVTVYDHSFRQIFTWHSARLYPSRLALSAGGRYLAAACPQVQNGYLGTVLYFMDTRSSTETAAVTLKEDSVLALQVLPGTKLLAVCDTAAIVYDMKTGAETARYAYGGRSLVAFSCEKGRRLALCFGNPERAEGEGAVVLNNKLETVAEIPLSGAVDGLICTNSELWRLSGATLEKYTLKDAVLAETFALAGRGRALAWAGGPVAVELAFLEKFG